MSLKQVSRLVCTCGRRFYATDFTKDPLSPLDNSEAALEPGTEEVQNAPKEPLKTTLDMLNEDYAARAAEHEGSGPLGSVLAQSGISPFTRRSGSGKHATWVEPPARTTEVPRWAMKRYKVYLPSMPPPEQRVEVARVRLHAYTPDRSRLLFFADFARRASDALNIPTRSFALSTEIAAASMNVSPFVHAKTKSYYWRRTHRRELIAYNASPKVIQHWFEYLRRTIMPGIGIRTQTIGRHEVGFGQNMGKAPPSSKEKEASEEEFGLPGDLMIATQVKGLVPDDPQRQSGPRVPDKDVGTAALAEM